MSWGKWRKSFFVAGAAHCRLEGWKRWFRCTGAGFRESDTFASHLHWDLQFQSGVLEVLNRAVPLGFAMQIVSSEVRFCEKSRVKRSFWKFGLSLLVKVSWKMLVLKAWIVTFGESLVENARFESLDCHFWWKSRGKCSFWKLGLSLLVKVSWKMLVFGKIVQQECQERVSSKSVQQECLARVSCNSVCVAGVPCQVSQECPRVSRKSVQQECPARVSRKTVKQRVSCQECQARVSCQECQARVSSKECPARVFS